MKQLLSALLSAALLFCVPSGAIAAGTPLITEQSIEVQEQAYSAAYLDYLNHPERYQDGIIPAPYEPKIDNDSFAALAEESSLPGTYDPRKTGTDAALTLPAVRDQGDHGDCWAFGATAALEISNLKRGLAGSYDENTIFSESHMAASLYDQSKKESEWAPWTFNLPIAFPDDTEEKLNKRGGGNRQMAAAYYARGSGPVLEKDFPQNYYRQHKYTYGEVASVKQKNQVSNIIYVTDGDDITNGDRTALKKAIQKYGAVSTSYHAPGGTKETQGEEVKTYFNSETNAYYYNGKDGSNHEIAIVGWNDNYSTTNFNSVCQPNGNGAWIVRNSWGTDWGDNGYFYISYEDVLIGRSASAYDGMTDAYEHVYQHDPLGGALIFPYSYNQSVWLANRFNKGDGSTQTLNAVGLFIFDPGSVIKIMVDTDIPVSSQEPDVDGLAFIPLKSADDIKNPTSITFSNPGYYVVELDEPLTIEGKFDVIVNLTKNNQEDPLFSAEQNGWYDSDGNDGMKNVQVNTGESFIGSQYNVICRLNTKLNQYEAIKEEFGNNWSDLSQTSIKISYPAFDEDGKNVSEYFKVNTSPMEGLRPSNACIKAYTSAADPISLGGTVSNTDNSFTVTVKDNEGSLSAASLLVGIYDQKGALLSSWIKDLNFVTDNSYTTDAILFGPEAAYYKAFLWSSKDAMTPLRKSTVSQPLTYHAAETGGN